MAKSRNYEFVDRLARKARLANAQRQHTIERHELRNMNRMGWQDLDREIAEEVANEIDQMGGYEEDPAS